MTSPGKVAVTGMGLFTPLGKSVEETWKGVLAGDSGISRRDERAGGPECLKYFGKVDGYVKPENVPSGLTGQMRFLTRGSLLGFEAASEAIRDSRLDLSTIACERRAVFVAPSDLTSVGYESLHPALREATKQNADHLDMAVLNKAMLHRAYPFYLLEWIYNNLFSFLSAVFGFMGPNSTLAALSPCGSNAIEMACRTVSRGDADIALAVGCTNLTTEIPMYEMARLGLLSKCEKGVRSFRPLDRERDGFIPAEGGAAVLLEDAQQAEKRGATIYALISGFGNCMEFPTDGGTGFPDMISRKSMESALKEGLLDAGDLAFICSHGSGTREGDHSELRSIADLLGGSGVSVPICALKPYTGHMGSASDLCEVVLGIRALSEGIVPGTPNFSGAGPEFQDLGISASARSARGKGFVAVSYAMLGQSACVLVEAA